MHFHDKQKMIMEFLLDKSEGATLEEISSHLGVTKTAAKEHILKLEHQGLVSFRDTKGTVGRPKRSYLLSDAGHEVFPRQYSWLSSVLLEYLSHDLGSNKVSAMMKDLGKKVAESMAPRFQKKNSAEALSEVNLALNELGYRSYVKQSDVRKGAIIEASNCVYHSVAKEHPELCHFDIQFIESATGLKVKLESCIARGGSICRFCVKKPE
jgi:predicted ArsR family transcriptional regulator